MTKKQHIGFVILAVAIFGIMFYWYSLRPSIIKKDCYNIAREKAIEKANRELKERQNYFSKEDYNAYYKWCLQKKGL